MIRFVVLTVSDGVAAGERQDTSGPLIGDWIERRGWSVVERRSVPDETAAVAGALSRWADSGVADVIITTGGTGFGPRDVTPEATSAVIERAAPGIAEALRAAGIQNTPLAMLSRGLAGIRRRSLIVNLPGSEAAVRQGIAALEAVLPHAVELLGGKTEHD